MIIKLLIEGGEMKVNPTIAQKLGPLGLNMGKIIADVNSATAKFKGTKVPVALDVNPKTKTYSIEVSTPPTSELLKKELGLEKGTSASKKIKVGNAAIEQIIKVAKTKQDDMLVNDFKRAVKNVIGSCVSSGILIESKEAKSVSKEVDEGIYDSLINKQITEAKPDKLKKLAEDYEAVKIKQEIALKAEEEAKAAEEAAKAAATAPGAAAAAPTIAGAEKIAAKPGAKTAEVPAKAAEAPAKEAKKEEKKK